jgi:hypothetical protein
MVDPFSIIGIIIIAVLVLFLGKIVSFLGKVLFTALLVTLVLVFIFGVSFDQVIDWFTNALLMVF